MFMLQVLAIHMPFTAHGWQGDHFVAIPKRAVFHQGVVREILLIVREECCPSQCMEGVIISLVGCGPRQGDTPL